MALAVGAPAPSIETVDQDGKKIKPDLKQKTVLYFYPKDDTPGCTYAQRVTFLIQDGVIQKIFPTVNPGGHSQEVLHALDALRI